MQYIYILSLFINIHSINSISNNSIPNFSDLNERTNRTTLDVKYCQADYIGFSFETPTTYQIDTSTFSQYGLSRFQNISFKIQVNCKEFYERYSSNDPFPEPTLYIYGDPQIGDPIFDELDEWMLYTDLKMNTFHQDPIADAEITKPDVMYSLRQWEGYLNLSNYTTNNWYNIWRLETDISYIRDVTCDEYFPTPKPTLPPTDFGAESVYHQHGYGKSLPTQAPTPQPTSYEHYFNTFITFYWYSEYSQYFPIFQNIQTVEDQTWIDSRTNLSFELIWNTNITQPLLYNVILTKDDANWLKCFYPSDDIGDDAINNDWQLGISTYIGCEDDYCNWTNITDIDEIYDINDIKWEYELYSIPYMPMLSWRNCNVSVIEEGVKLCERFEGSSQFFNLYFWYDDDVWTNSLSLYQTLTQYAIEEALCDLYNESYPNNDPLTPQDFYLEVSFFFDFCLLASSKCPNYEHQKAEDELVFYPPDIGNEDTYGYQMYTTIESSESIAKKIYDLINDDTRAYIFMDYILRRCVEDQGRPNFIISGIAIGDLPRDLVFSVPTYISYGIYGFVVFCTLFAIVGAIHGFVYWGADCIRISGIVYFGLYTWDFYSDIIFNLELLNYDNTQILFYCCAVFIIIPWVANMISLSRYQTKWCKDDSIRERVFQWFVSWQRLTYALAAISGSAFGTVELANSYVFGLDFFCMGLNETHLKKFNNNRLWSGIIAENTPQLCIQFWFLSLQDWEPESSIVWLAIITSSLSIGAALLDIYSAKKLFDVLKNDKGEYLKKVPCSMFVNSQEIKEKRKKLQITTYAFRDALAETLTTHPRAVVMHFPITTANGFKMKFTVFSKWTQTQIYKSLRKDAISNNVKIEPELPKKIKKVWNLKLPVRVPLDKIEVGTVNPNDIDFNDDDDDDDDDDIAIDDDDGDMDNKHDGPNNKLHTSIELQQTLNKVNEGAIKNNNNVKNAKNAKNTYDVSIFTKNLNNIDNEKDKIPDIISFDINDNDNNDNYNAQMAALNAQIAMNQYLMFQQLSSVKQNNNNSSSSSSHEKTMWQQMKSMNNMINNKNTKYDPLDFQKLNDEWNKHSNNSNQTK